MSAPQAGDPQAGDLLAPFRRDGALPKAQPQERPQPQAGGYRAFGVASGQAKPVRLDIRAAKGLAVARGYSSLAEIAYDRASYTGIMLLFPQKLVTIKGRNLKPVVESLLAGTCEFLQQAGEGEQAEGGAPVIEEIITAGATPAARDAPAKPAPKAGG